jgi:hypothetical protein
MKKSTVTRKTTGATGYFINVEGWSISGSTRDKKMKWDVYIPFDKLPLVNRGGKFNLILSTVDAVVGSNEGYFWLNGQQFITKRWVTKKINMNSRSTSTIEINYK